MKGKVITFNGQQYEVYNTTQDMLHTVLLRKDGTRYPAKGRYLHNWRPSEIKMGQAMGVLTVE